jgi:hypothetical protein
VSDRERLNSKLLNRVIQLLLLPFLLALLAAGGKATLCQALSLSGLDVHHDVEWINADGSHLTPLCANDHESEEHEETPCSESCEIRLSEAPAPLPVKVPVIAEIAFLPSLFEKMEHRIFPVPSFESSPKEKPPASAVSLTDPTFTGRYLV